jgi:hypothetical protein
MSRNRPLTTMRTAAAALLALAGFSLVVPAGSARAGCVYPHGAPGKGVAHLDLLARNGALTTPDGRVPSLPLSPCAGLRCSNDPAPSSPPVPLAPARAESWGDLLGLPPVDRPTSRRLAAAEPVVHPSHHSLPLLRPPR